MTPDEWRNLFKLILLGAVIAVGAWFAVVATILLLR